MRYFLLFCLLSTSAYAQNWDAYAQQDQMIHDEQEMQYQQDSMQNQMQEQQMENEEQMRNMQMQEQEQMREQQDQLNAITPGTPGWAYAR